MSSGVRLGKNSATSSPAGTSITFRSPQSDDGRHLFYDPKRIAMTATDFGVHFEKRIEALEAKAMTVWTSPRI